MPWGIAQQLLQQGFQSGSRSTVVSNLGWMAVILGGCVLGALQGHAPDWLLIFFAVLFAVDFTTFIGIYIYFALTDSDALRSERYTIQKLAIERHLLGDGIGGLFEIEPDATSQSQIAGPSKPSEGDD